MGAITKEPLRRRVSIVSKRQANNSHTYVIKAHRIQVLKSPHPLERRLVEQRIDMILLVLVSRLRCMGCYLLLHGLDEPHQLLERWPVRRLVREAPPDQLEEELVDTIDEGLHPQRPSVRVRPVLTRAKRRFFGLCPCGLALRVSCDLESKLFSLCVMAKRVWAWLAVLRGVFQGSPLVPPCLGPVGRGVEGDEGLHSQADMKQVGPPAVLARRACCLWFFSRIVLDPVPLFGELFLLWRSSNQPSPVLETQLRRSQSPPARN